MDQTFFSFVLGMLPNDFTLFTFNNKVLDNVFVKTKTRTSKKAKERQICFEFVIAKYLFMIYLASINTIEVIKTYQ